MDSNIKGIYDCASNGTIYSPFNLKIDEMERLLLIGFEKDPDSIYSGFEPQYFDDDTNGKGLKVIAWRLDGFVDVYQQPTLAENKNFDVAGKGLADLLVRPMVDAKFIITEMGVEVYFAFEDKAGRQIEVLIKEESNKPSKPFDLLAPVGSSSEKPSSLPLFFLYHFSFVRKGRTQVKIDIGGIAHKPDGFPMPMDGSKIYFMRYAKDPFLAQWNVAHNGPLSEVTIDEGMKTDVQGTMYDLIENEGHIEIQKISCSNKKHCINISFSPPIPDIVCLKPVTTLQGKFTISSELSVGTVGGGYYISKNGKSIEIKVIPSDGWQPNERRGMVKFIYRVATIFKKWPMSYIWNGNIELSENCVPTMQSAWARQLLQK